MTSAGTFTITDAMHDSAVAFYNAKAGGKAAVAEKFWTEWGGQKLSSLALAMMYLPNTAFEDFQYFEDELSSVLCKGKRMDWLMGQALSLTAQHRFEDTFPRGWFNAFREASATLNTDDYIRLIKQVVSAEQTDPGVQVVLLDRLLPEAELPDKPYTLRLLQGTQIDDIHVDVSEGLDIADAEAFQYQQQMLIFISAVREIFA